MQGGGAAIPKKQDDGVESIDWENRLRRAEEELRQVSAITAHDLRESLRAVGTHAELLNRCGDESVTPETKENISSILRGLRRLRDLADGLAGYSAVLEERTQPPNIIRVETALQFALAKLEKRFHQVRAAVSHGPLPGVTCSVDRLSLLFENLVANALLYRSEEEPHVHVSAERRGSHWLFAVRDNGIGIDPVYVDTIFAPFKRLHGHEYPGPGLGLSVCRRIVESYRGSIWVESTGKGGSTFFFTLPVVEEDSEER